MEILHPVSILNFLSSSSCNSARTKKILPELDNHRESMTLCRFFKMAAIPSQIFLLSGLWHIAFRKAKNYLRIKFRPDISIHGQVVTTSGRWRQTSAIFTFYSRFRRTLRHHRHIVILHWPTKFYTNRMIADGVMTSYWFLQDGDHSVANLYFQCLIWPRVTFRKIQCYRHYKFRPDISIHGRDITTSGFWKQTIAILKF